MINQIGQLFITGVSGKELTNTELEFLRNHHLGGVLLFAHNYESPAQLADLVTSIQETRQELPMLIAVDHEGGRVVRFREHFTQFGPMLDIAQKTSPKTIYDVYSVMAKELQACGVNVNLAPVCDVLTNSNNKVIGDRAFGDNEETVSKMISGAIRGLQTNKIIACAKHFPGHGNTTKDSHFDLPYVTKSLDELESLEIKPFSKAVRSKVEMMMMAHLVVDAFDTELPTTLSKNAYDYIREKLRFKKVIISDDMTMKAITDHFSYDEAAIMALQAGCDLLEYRDMDSCKEAIEGVYKACSNGRLENSLIHEKFERVKALKHDYIVPYTPIVAVDVAGKIGTDENLKLAKETSN